MAIQWKIQGGTVASATELKDLGLSGMVRIRRSLALDEVTFRHDGAAVDSTPLFAYGDTVTITRVDGGTPTTWFVGRMVEVPRVGNGRMESIAYRVAGTWWYFENLVYQQIWPLDAGANSHLTSPTTYRRAIAIAGMASTTGLRQNLKDFLIDVLDWLIAADTPNMTQYTAGELPAGFSVPFARLDAPTCAEAVRWITRWIPDAASFFDYSVSPPKFNLHRRSGATTVSVAATAVSAVDVTPRNELKIDKLLIQFVTLNASGLVVLNEDKDPSGAGTTGKDFGNVVLTIDNNYEPIPTGLAANFRAGLSTLQYSGSLTIEERECSQTIRPGHLVNITGGAAVWETMAAQVQEVIEEIDAGRTTVRFGPAAHVRIDDLLQILKIAAGQVDETGGSFGVLKTGQSSSERMYEAPLTWAGFWPTATEIATSFEACYTGTAKPKAGDILYLYVGDTNKFRGHVHDLGSSITGADFIVGITANGVTKYVHVTQLGIF